MYHVSAQSVDERMINYYYYNKRKRNTEDNALSAVHVRARTSLTRCRAVHVRLMTTQASTSLTRCRSVHVRMMTTQASTSFTRCRAVHVRMMTKQASTSLTRCRSVYVIAVGDRPVRHSRDVGVYVRAVGDRPVRHLRDVGVYVRAVGDRPVHHLPDVGQCILEWWLYRPERHLLDVGLLEQTVDAERRAAQDRNTDYHHKRNQLQQHNASLTKRYLTTPHSTRLKTDQNI